MGTWVSIQCLGLWVSRFHVLNGNLWGGGGGGLFGHQLRQNFRKIDSPGGLLRLFLEKLNI